MLKQRQGSKALHSQRAIASAPFGIINLRKDQAAPLCVLYKRPAPPFLQASHARTPGYSFPQGQGTHLGAFTCQPLSPAGIQCSPFSRSLLLLQFLSPPPLPSSSSPSPSPFPLLLLLCLLSLLLPSSSHQPLSIHSAVLYTQRTNWTMHGKLQEEVWPRVGTQEMSSAGANVPEVAGGLAGREPGVEAPVLTELEL